MSEQKKNKKRISIITILGIFIAVIVLFAGDNVYEQITGESFYQYIFSNFGETPYPVDKGDTYPLSTETPYVSVVATQRNAGSCTSVLTSEKDLLINENFEDGVANGFSPNGGSWNVIKTEDRSMVMQASSPSWAYNVFGPSLYSNGIIEFCVKFIEAGSVFLDFRISDSQSYVFIADQANNNFAIFYSDKNYKWNVMPQSERRFNFDMGIWYTIRLEVDGTTMSAFVDDTQILAVEDTKLTRGSLEFGLWPGTTVQIDDIKIVEYE